MKLKRNTILMTISEAANIPIVLFISYSISTLIPLVQEGNSESVAMKSIWLLLITLILTIVRAIYLSFSRKRVELNNHTHRMKYYKAYLENYDNMNSSLGSVVTVFDSDYKQFTSFYSTVLPSIVSGFISMAIYTYVITMSNVYVAFLFLGLGFIQAVPIILLMHNFMVNYEKVLEIEEKITDSLIERYDSNFTTRILNLHKHFKEKLLGLHKTYYTIGKKSEALLTKQKAATEGVKYLLTYGIYCIIGLFYVKGILNLKEASAIAIIIGSLYHAMQDVFKNIIEISKYKVSKKRLDNLTKMRIPKLIDDKKNRNNYNQMLNKNDKMLNVTDLSVSDDKKNILKPISFVLHEKDKMYIVGSNGSGKSTLMKVICGLSFNFQGHITFLGNKLTTNSREIYLKNIAYLTQEDPNLTITVSTLLELIGDSKQCYYGKISKALKELSLNIEEISKSRISDLSPGERKKLFLSITFLSKSQMLVLDEPSNQLDEDSIGVLIDWINKSPKSFLIVTHNQRMLDNANTLNQEIIQLQGETYAKSIV